jgi:inosine triphosphate pyrophosphatase
MLKTIKLISSNEGKLREMKHYLSSELEKSGFSLEMLPIELTEIQGTATEVILDKINRASEVGNFPVICEDTCLCFNAWNGLPGAYM